jgi:CheY-like chemotaxis protein
VDDDPDCADSLVLVLRHWGHDPRAAYDGWLALHLSVDHRPDVVFLDLALAGMDGYAVADGLRRQPGPGRPCLVALTGYSDEAHRQAAEASFDHFLVKPVGPATLRGLLARVAVTRGLAHEVRQRGPRHGTG